MAGPARVPVVDVQSDNLAELWPSLVLALRSATFVAVDTSQNTYLCQIYNLTLLCVDDYVVEPHSVQFLVQHGFDFNKQYSQGIPYHKGDDKDKDSQSQGVRTLFLELIRAKKPLVLHNGLIDLVFLYQCFYAHLPESLGTFTADLSEMFPAGIYDSKYASEFEARFVASYLEYAYKKCKKENCKLKDSSRQHLIVEFCNYPASVSRYIDYRYCSLEEESHNTGEGKKVPVCEKFSAYGWCPKGVKCPHSHNIDRIIDEDDELCEKRRKRKQRWKNHKNTKASAKAVKEENSGEQMEQAQNEEEGPPKKQSCCEPAAATELAEITPNGEGGPLEENAMDVETEVSSDTSTPWEENLGNTEETAAQLAAALSPSGKGNSDQVERKEEVSWGLGSVRHTDSPKTEAAGAAGKEKETHVPPSQGGTHRAGFDAFMTGYIMAYMSLLKQGENRDNGAEPWLPDCHNKLYLSGKSVPLQIVKSLFSKSSKAHSKKIKLAWDTA
ncbi:Target of EGR1 protein 1 [Willisornis vidua]|uniref:Target of EGR1 protein 1 n=1 Tax=Willisornis vidua TaxID=1566151 RepID=A0ABQ9CVJ0_9PASS|nr:Target of EGR1 protein 1 [Willisornis vidua]